MSLHIISHIARILSSFVVCILITSSAFSQSTPHSFLLPIDIPPLLSANYGELRPNHFHGGLDFKTQSIVGKNLIAIDSGYVSRIQVRPSGYGLALYITHYNGYTSVYGHLLSLNQKIDSVVKAYQKFHTKNIVDIHFQSHELPIQRGEIIGLSGNSGSSGGPHLHFEIRDSKTQNTLNPLLFYPQIVDKSRPKITAIGVYPLDSSSFVSQARSKKFYKVLTNKSEGLQKISEPIHAWGTIGFSVQGNDFMQGTGHVYGFYTVKLLCNDTVLYARRIDEISFENTADINSFIDYTEYAKTKRYFEKAFVEPNNTLQVYTHLHNYGKYSAKTIDTVTCEFIVGDFNENMAAVTFTVIQQPIHDTILSKLPPYPQKNSCKLPFTHTLQGFTFTGNEQTFFTDFTFTATVDTLNPKKRYHSHRYSIKSDQLIFKKAASIQIQSHVPKELQEKAIIELSNAAGAKSPILATFDEQGIASGYTKRPGTFGVVLDTVAPFVKPNFANNGNLQANKSLSFKISDNFSGIKEYNAYVDDEWVILNYDAKSATVYLKFADTNMQFNTKHSLRIEVRDMCNNTTTKEYSFFK
ncbi:MAG TPA: peptidoglycan DD-metalloendopeptidase family protein [Bacteroidales bacterium]|nr:MAG: Murein DD-endopeptidase MepM [Bacteroidetes bacterium ADurb.Bin217]HPM13091.1 peptidoglycan DD-metalloendopeptidase family protein [Bacteroidales bacterium]